MAVALAVAVGTGVATEVAVTRMISGVAVLVGVGSNATMSPGFGSERGIDTRLVTQAGRYATNHQRAQTNQCNGCDHGNPTPGYLCRRF